MLIKVTGKLILVNPQSQNRGGWLIIAKSLKYLPKY